MSETPKIEKLRENYLNLQRIVREEITKNTRYTLNITATISFFIRVSYYLLDFRNSHSARAFVETLNEFYNKNWRSYWDSISHEWKTSFSQMKEDLLSDESLLQIQQNYAHDILCILYLDIYVRNIEKMRNRNDYINDLINYGKFSFC